MYGSNITMITQILLLGFQNQHSVNVLIFFILLAVYCLTVCGNFLIITLVSLSKNLHSPMYLFLSQLSVTDIMLTTNISPNMLYIIINGGAAMSFEGCITQFYFFGVTECSECLLLTIMSYDRYLAICSPLKYSSIMNYMRCLKLIVMSWLASFSVILIHIITICKMEFCGPNVIDHFFCDFTPLLDLICSDTSLVRTEGTLLGIPILIIPFIIVIVSYVCIVHAILKIQSNTGRQKAFSTCSSHLCVVSIFYGTLFCIYALPNEGQSLTVSKILSLLYTVVTPLLNPIIYSLRNKDIKKAMVKIIGNKKSNI
ncbi:PREDICTED: olfactory receptor 11L1-like [Nanorana parkeri]|uniref:olfactory receptor 11L1-like n=1 Tax=Nanorana parkeri TaxID=125878 RepID=UPI00085492D9|nr:PREDICTED: olfactory receptor 11L1-like [Nanorana parkeri]